LNKKLFGFLFLGIFFLKLFFCLLFLFLFSLVEFFQYIQLFQFHLIRINAVNPFIRLKLPIPGNSVSGKTIPWGGLVFFQTIRHISKPEDESVYYPWSQCTRWPQSATCKSSGFTRGSNNLSTRDSPGDHRGGEVVFPDNRVRRFTVPYWPLI